MARKPEYIQRRGAPVRRGARKKTGPPALFILILAVIVILVIVIIVAVVSHAGRGGEDDAKQPDSRSATASALPDEDDGQSGPDETTSQAEPTAQPVSTAATPPPEKIPTGTPEKLDSFFRVGDTAYEYYNFVTDYANAYISTVSDGGKKLSGATLYDMVIPTSMDIMLSEDFIQQNDVNSSNQQRAIEYLYASINAMNPEVKTVPLFDALKLHNNEYIYFRTDHHWTQLGSYYAYVEFCKVKGIQPVALSDFDRADYPGFLGSFYSDEPNDAMANNPDTVEAYLPKAQTTMDVTQADGVVLEDWPLIQDGTDYATSMKYLIYAAGDQPYEEITNLGLHDGSACLIVKESFGNCFIPFLVNHYEKVYVIDYRHYGGTISALAAEKGVQDVILCNNISMTRNEGLIDDLANTF